MKVALIDFCETIVDHQTFDPFMEYVLRHERQARYRLVCIPVVKAFCSVLTRILCKLGCHIYIYKDLLVSQMKGLDRERLEMLAASYYTECLQPHFIPQTLALLRELVAQGCALVIVSGGCDLYIRHFAEAFGIYHVMAAEFAFSQGVCTGKLKTECMGKEKIVRVQKWMAEMDLHGKCTVGVSDSASDQPMFSLCDRKIVISRQKHQDWVTSEMEEIIWG